MVEWSCKFQYRINLNDEQLIPAFTAELYLYFTDLYLVTEVPYLEPMTYACYEHFMWLKKSL